MVEKAEKMPAMEDRTKRTDQARLSANSRSSRLPRDTSFTWLFRRLVFADFIKVSKDQPAMLRLFANGVGSPCLGLASCVLTVGGHESLG